MGIPTHRKVGPPQGLPTHLPQHFLGTNIVRALLAPVSQWRILTALKWSLPGAAVVPVLNVSSRVFWLELDDKALLDSYGVLQEGILCDVFSQKCSAAWQGARGERLTVSVMLPGRQDADDWLNFIAEELVAYLRNAEYSHGGNLSTGIQQRTAKAAGPAFVDGGQSKVGGAS